MPSCGTSARSSAVGFAVPTSKWRYTWRESALTIVIGRRSASHIAMALFPLAVGPQITPTSVAVNSVAAESSVDLIPRELDDRRSAVHVVRGKRGVAQRGV